MKPRVLVAAGDASLRAQIARWLMAAGYAVELAESPKRMRDVLAQEEIALAILVPDRMGDIEVAHELGQEVDRLILITGSENGTDSVPNVTARLTQPLNEADLLACVKDALPTSPETEDAPADTEVLQFQGYTLDVGARTCRAASGDAIALTRSEFVLLLGLARRAGRVVSRNELSQLATGREASPDDRGIDMMMSRLRRKLEADPKAPRLIVTVPGEGYRFTADPAPAVAERPAPALAQPEPLRLEAVADAVSTVAPAAPAADVVPRLQSKFAWALGAVAATLVVVVIGLVIWIGGPVPSSKETAAGEKFDASLVPLVADVTRRSLASYRDRPDHKALAISAQRYGIAFGAPNQEAAEREALERCKASYPEIKVDTPCRIYARGMDVVWSRQSVPLPWPADFRVEPLDERVIPNEIQAWRSNTRSALNEYLQARGIKALAVSTVNFFRLFNGDNPTSAGRAVVERCGDVYQTPCLLIAINENLTVRIPASHHITNIFMLATDAQMSETDKRRVAEIYAQKDWRALARGKSGWYPIANAATEAAAVEAVLASCAKQDTECRLYAIGNFLIDDAGTGAPTREGTQEKPAVKFDASVVPFLSDKARNDLARYAGQPGYKALALSTQQVGLVSDAPEQGLAEQQALEQCKSRADPKTDTPCRLYATGMDVVWPASAIPRPLPADAHATPLDIRLEPNALSFWSERMRRSLEGYLKLPNPKALAIIGGDNNMFGVEDFDSESSAVRATIERCSYFFQQPCLIFAIDDNLTVRIPTSRRIRDVFILSSDQQMSSADRQRIAEIYGAGDWRALARGKNGWYPVANAPSEAEAITAAGRACAERDIECRLYAIGNFLVDDARGPAPSQGRSENPVVKFDASVVPFFADKDRRNLESYANRPNHKALAISTARISMTFDSPDRERAEREALERCKAQVDLKVDTPCRLYASDMDVVWPSSAIPRPLPADAPAAALDLSLKPAELPLWYEKLRQSFEDYLKLPGSKALAVVRGENHMFGVSGFPSETEAARAVVERCSYFYQQPCLLFAVNDNLAVRFPVLRRVGDFFILTSDQQISSADRQRIAEVYGAADWRALARGKSGWYPVANASSEADAIAAAGRACAERDTECRLYAIGNFRVTDESLP